MNISSILKAGILSLTLIYSQANHADHNRLVIDDVTITTHAECLMNEISDNWDTAENWMSCGMNHHGIPDYMFFRKSDKFIENVVYGDRKKEVHQLGDDYFVRVIFVTSHMSFLYIQKCNLVIIGENARLMFSMMVDIKIDNDICR